MPAKKKPDRPLTGSALVKETCRRIRVARGFWDAHNNRACRSARAKALEMYETLSPEEREKVPQVLRVWLRYRSEKYFGDHRTAPGTKPPAKRRGKNARKGKFTGSSPAPAPLPSRTGHPRRRPS